jgi:hypothetical protein
MNTINTKDETGVDPDTGLILDEATFRRWQQRTRNVPIIPTVSLGEVLRKGRFYIQAWVDDEGNRLRVLHADLDKLRREPFIKRLMDDAASYGKELQAKLMDHLMFTIENRRKYYKAVAKRKSGKKQCRRSA